MTRFMDCEKGQSVMLSKKLNTNNLNGNAGNNTGNGSKGTGNGANNHSDSIRDDKNLSSGKSTKNSLDDSIHQRTSGQSSDKKSKLSAGPINPQHITYRQNEKLIRQEISETIAKRSISAKVSKICKQASISTPTFYLHHRNPDEALMSYEEELYGEFLRLVVENAKKYTQEADKIHIFELLLLYIGKNNGYFRASLVSNNLHLLYNILGELCVYVVGDKISDRTGLFYITNLLAVIMWWGNEEGFSKQKLGERAREMAAVRVWYKG